MRPKQKRRPASQRRYASDAGAQHQQQRRPLRRCMKEAAGAHVVATSAAARAPLPRRRGPSKAQVEAAMPMKRPIEALDAAASCVMGAVRPSRARMASASGKSEPSATLAAQPPPQSPIGARLAHNTATRDSISGATNQRMDGPAVGETELIKAAARRHDWHWNREDKSEECEVGADPREVCFHPECSESAAAIRGSEPLPRDGNFYYWEVSVADKAYGTSVMFGLCTKRQQLHYMDFCNLVGLDREGWSLSHKGLIWHNKMRSPYTQPFPANQPLTVGLLFNTMRGELSYYLDGKSLGVAFCGLNKITEDLYPVIGSTAKCTRMRLLGAYRGYLSLLERAGFTLLKQAADSVALVNQLHLLRVPKNLIDYLADIAQVRQGDGGAQNTKHQANQKAIQSTLTTTTTSELLKFQHHHQNPFTHTNRT